MTSAIIFAFASAFFLGAGVVLAQLGLRTVEPLSGAAISVPSFTLLFLLLSFYLAIFDRVNPIYFLEPSHPHADNK